MMSAQYDYLSINKELWNLKTPNHIKSDFYGQEAFLGGKSSLNAVELNLLGDVQGKDILHLQCHFGQDSLSLARMGAQVTGIDLADEAINYANTVAKELQLNAQFVCDDVYNTFNILQKQFDIVFASYGTIGWLPDLMPWAKMISQSLKPNGKLVFVEFHPVIWMFDNDFKQFQYSYFNVESIVDNEEGTYADREANIKATAISWNHPLTDVLQSLLANGLQIDTFHEYDFSPYNCFSNCLEIAPGKFQIEGLEGKIPMVYAITATKK
ncbi:class I SAM-dependent methyltransferase [Sphingobacterium sp. HJSM2_6]|uniref:class I SAM-dependent methyltransferase n=1 Tax=Sphingobacterium sp. HJSM2_6 TaxID=3366264 RepID=UPI003BEC93AE